MSEQSGEDGFDLVNLVTQDTRYAVLQCVYYHPKMSPSLTELDVMIPEKSAGTVSGHVDKLVDAGVLKRLILPQGQRTGGPTTFYTPTDEGHDLLARHDLLPDNRAMMDVYDRTKKSDKIQRFEEETRPDPEVEYTHPLNDDTDE